MKGFKHILFIGMAFIIASCEEPDVIPKEFVVTADYYSNPDAAQSFQFYNNTYENSDWQEQYVLQLETQEGSFTDQKLLQLESLQNLPGRLFGTIAYMHSIYRITYEEELQKSATITLRYDFPYQFIPESEQSYVDRYFLNHPDSIKLYRATYQEDLFKYGSSDKTLEITEIKDFTLDKENKTIHFETKDLGNFFFAGYQNFQKDDQISITFSGKYNMDYSYHDNPPFEGLLFQANGEGGGISNNSFNYEVEIYDISKYFETGSNTPLLYDFSLKLNIENIKEGLIDHSNIDFVFDVVSFDEYYEFKKRFYTSDFTRVVITDIEGRGGYITGYLTGTVREFGLWDEVGMRIDFKVKRMF